MNIDKTIFQNIKFSLPFIFLLSILLINCNDHQKSNNEFIVFENETFIVESITNGKKTTIIISENKIKKDSLEILVDLDDQKATLKFDTLNLRNNNFIFQIEYNAPVPISSELKFTWNNGIVLPINFQTRNIGYHTFLECNDTYNDKFINLNDVKRIPKCLNFKQIKIDTLSPYMAIDQDSNTLILRKNMNDTINQLIKVDEKIIRIIDDVYIEIFKEKDTVLYEIRYKENFFYFNLLK